MNNRIFGALVAISLSLATNAAHAFTSTIWNSSSSTIVVEFYNAATASSPYVVTGSAITLSPGMSATGTGGYAGQWGVINRGPSYVQGWTIDSGNATYAYGTYGPGTSMMLFIGGGANADIRTGTPPDCSGTVRWGTGSSCSAPATTTKPGGSIKLVNSAAGAKGSTTAICSSAGAWTVSASSCDVDLLPPASVSASDGTAQSSIAITWPASAGATKYRLQQRKRGDTAWVELAVPTALTYTWSNRTDDSVFEFRVRAENALGESDWSSIDPGWIRPTLDATFVSQAGVPSKIGINQAFTFTQIWRNSGSQTWTGGTFGTAHSDAEGAIQWAVPVTAFTGSTAFNAQVTTTLSAKAPATPGVYKLQRVVQKSGVVYGTASTLTSIIVLDTPQCSAVKTDVGTTYDPNGSIVITLVNPISVETASLKVWGSSKGESASVAYPMTLKDGEWSVVVPVAPHLTEGETRISMSAIVGNGVFPSTPCATGSVFFQQLPIPEITLTPTFGTFGDSARRGFVVNRAGGEFAKLTVNLGEVSDRLKARVDVFDESGQVLNAPMTEIAANTATSVLMSASTLSAASVAWRSQPASVRVSYADAAAAAQGKVLLVPIAWSVPPGGLTVIAKGTASATPSVNASIAGAAGFSSETYGAFSGYLKSSPSGARVGLERAVSAGGLWSVEALDYKQLYATQLIAVARANPPDGMTVFNPVEFTSVVFTLPVVAPASVEATDGSREDDVRVTWPAVATGDSIRYRVFRDGSEITPSSGLSALELLDVPPQRGTEYVYSVKTMINNVLSTNDASDKGSMPVCRAARLIGASVNADMSAISGLVEQWLCLQSVDSTAALDSGAPSLLELNGSSSYRSFTYPIPEGVVDGAHLLRLAFKTEGLSLNAERTYDIPFTLARGSITVRNLTIVYDETPAIPGIRASSIGRFGIRMDGGSGIGFAQEVK